MRDIESYGTYMYTEFIQPNSGRFKSIQIRLRDLRKGAVGDLEMTPKVR